MLAALKKRHELHEQQALIYECVDGVTIAEVISGWTGIPLGGMVADEIDTVRNLHALLERRVVGQPHVALKTGPVLAQIVPQACKVGPALCRLSRVKDYRKLGRQRRNRSQMIDQQVPARMGQRF